MTKIAFAARYADDTPYGHGRLTIRLVNGGSGAALPGGLAVVPVRNVNLDADGEAIVDLTPNGDITDPVGTFYAITVNDSTPTVVRYIEVPAPNGSGDLEVPYAWDDETIQRLAVNPPTSIPAPGSGTVGQVVTVVDNGDGKVYELGDLTDTGVDVDASAPMFKPDTVVAAYEAAADVFGVDPAIKAITSASLPVLVTDPGVTQKGINENASVLAQGAIAGVDRARTDAAEAAAAAAAELGAVAFGAGAPGRAFTSPDPYLLVGAGTTPSGYQENCYRMPSVAATFDDGVDFVGDAVLLDDCGIDGFREVGTHGRVDIDFDRFEAALRVQGGLVSLFSEYVRVGDAVVAGGEYAPGRIYSEDADPPVLLRVGERVKWRTTVENDRGDGHGRVRLWLPTEGVADETAHGVAWRIVQEIVLPTTTSVAISGTDYWYSGMGDGRFGVFEASFYEYGGAFSHRFHPDDEQPGGTLVDANGNVATPLGDASVVQPTAPGSGDVVGPGSSTDGRAVLFDGTTGKLIKQATAAPVLEGDARLTDARTPTAHKTSHATGGTDALAPSDIGAVPTSRTIAGLDLSADRSASAVAAALPIWQTIANTTLGSASGSQSFNVTGYRFVRITLIGRSNRNGTIDSVRVRFNSDTGSNYSTNTNAFTTFVGAGDVSGEATNTNRAGYMVIQWGYMAGAWLAGTAMSEVPTSTGTTAVNAVTNGWVWTGAASSAPTSVEVYTNLGQFVTGTTFLVEGRV